MHKHHYVVDVIDWNQWWSNRWLENTENWPENSFITYNADNTKVHGIVKGNKVLPLEHGYSPCGISAKNPEQLFALNILKDKDIPLKILTGAAGTGKTLLACAHALESQVNIGGDKKIVIAKSMTPVGREIGFLKGDMKEKVLPWLGPFLDNFQKCGYTNSEIELLIDNGILEITPITFIQGRSLSNCVLIVDEVQNLDLTIIKQIITRASDNTEVILLGDPSQKFEHHNDNTLETLLKRGEKSPLVGCVILEKTVRSPLADWAVQNL